MEFSIRTPWSQSLGPLCSRTSRNPCGSQGAALFCQLTSESAPVTCGGLGIVNATDPQERKMLAPCSAWLLLPQSTLRKVKDHPIQGTKDSIGFRTLDFGDRSPQALQSEMWNTSDSQAKHVGEQHYFWRK